VTDLTTTETDVLAALSEVGEDYSLYFRGIESRTGLDRDTVRTACRNLAGKGLAQYRRGLSDENTGMMAGAGYSITRAGCVALDERKAA